VEIGRFVLRDRGTSRALAHLRLLDASAEQASADVTLLDESGEVLGELGAVRVRRADLGALAKEGASATPVAFYRLDWQAARASERADLSGQRVLVVAEGSAADALATELRAQGAECSSC